MIFRCVLYFLVCLIVLQGNDAEARVRLKTLINDQPVQLILDTKSDTTVLFAHTAERIGLKWTKPTQAPTPGRVAAGKSEECRFDTGSGPHPAVFAVVASPRYQQANIDGVISWNDMKGEILFLDGERRQFSAIAAIPEWAKKWRQYPVKKQSGSLIMETEEADILIDTANDGSLCLGTGQWQQWTAKNKDARFTLDAYSTAMKPVVVDKIFYTNHFKAGSFEVENVLIQRDSSVAAETGSGVDISLGLDALTRLMIIVDGPHGVCYVEKSDNPPPPAAYNRMGAVFVPENIRTSDKLIAVVADNTPAADAGIQNGDALVQLDDIDVTKWRTMPGILPLSRFWAQPAGTKISLGILRDGKKLMVQVTLADILGTEKTITAPTR